MSSGCFKNWSQNTQNIKMFKENKFQSSQFHVLSVFNTYITAYTLNVSTLSVLPVAAVNFEGIQHLVCSW